MANIFLKIKSIQGASTVKGMENTIECLSFSWGGSLTMVGTGTTRAETVSQASVHDLSIMKHVDKSSPLLFANMMGGKRMQEDIELDVQKAVDGKSETFMSIKLTNAIVSSFQSSGGGDAPVESLTFNFVKVYFGHANEDKGKLEAQVIKGWDSATHEAL